MILEENKNTLPTSPAGEVDGGQAEEITTEENPISAEPKQDVVEDVSVIEKTQPVEEIEGSKIEKTEVFSPMTEIINGEPKQAQLTKPTEQPKEKTEEILKIIEPVSTPTQETPEAEEISKIETPPTTPTQENVQPQPIQQTQTQEIPSQPEIQTVEKIIYQTPPNFIQNLLNKARAKIQERKRKKLDKIISLFELNSEISNSDVRNLLRTARRSATRYLDILEKEQKITQVGSIGKGVKYIKK